MFSMILADIAWTLYFIKVEERKTIASGIWSALIVLVGAFTTVNYVNETRLFGAAMLGAFIGAALAVEWKKRKENSKNLK